MYKKLTILTIAIILTGAGCSLASKKVEPTPTPIYIPEVTDTPTPTATVTPTPSQTETPVLIPTPTTTSTTEVDISNWKTYSNKEYGFSFRYPEKWVFQTIGLPDDQIKLFDFGSTQKEGTELSDGMQIQFIFQDFKNIFENDLIKKYTPRPEQVSIKKGKYSTYNALISEGKVYYGDLLIDNSIGKRIVVLKDNKKIVILISVVNNDVKKYLDDLLFFEKSFLIQ